ncbi:hypothetical protein QQS21_004782 [Conoideocrella luteorostrata]|uniref:C2H2-type domain-containing protein n=1 Tax=Conoideocrella luteorostrata TaxID=1105319 RepID=A0AAJ0CQV4_9HYPO|nr:hypothetical protein QQS21_004782 [Conoideocrella luteorostrata]
MKMWNQCLDAEEELPSFSNVIQTSSAYQWLLAAVVQQASLSWRVSVADRVRVNILRSLVTTHVKHNDAPLPFRVSFRLRWEPVQAWVDREGRTSNTNLGPPLLSSLMVLTFVSGDEVQACTTEQYIRQVWPEGGVELLEPLQKLLDLETDCPSSLKSYKDSAGNIFSLEGSQLAITVCGPAHIIAQCGEQLSWLASAAQPGNPETAICTPCIKAIGWRKFSIEPRVEPHADAAGSLLLLTKPLRLLYERLASSCLVRGFAIAHRPEGVPGLELPWKTLLTVLQKPFLEPTCSHGYRLLRGTHTTLMLVKVISGVSMWYVVSSASLARVCSSSCLDQLQRENIQSVTMERLADLRHVINTCESVNAPTLHDSCHLKGSEKKVVDAATEYENHEAAAQYEEEFSSGSGAVQSLADISIDSDILSCSSSSQEAQLKQPVGDDKLSTIVAAVVNQLLADVKTSIFNRSTPTDGEYSNNGGSGSSTSTSSGTISLATGSQGGFQGTAQKRVISQRNSDEPGEDDSQRPPHKIQKQAQEIPQSTYACPFWKFDPVKYRTCFFLTLRTASRVKQHLIRKHVPEFYCQRCNAIFKSYEMHNEHVMDPSGYSCTPNPSERLDGITIHQNRLLSQKSRSLNEKDKWFDIWDILFPSCPRPSSPYVDVQLAEDCALFQEYSLKAGPDLVAQEIEASDALSTELAEDDRRELLRRAIAAGLIAIVETWSQTQEHPMNRNSNALLCSGRQGDEDLSGIGLSVTPIGSAPDSCGLRASHTPEGSTSQPIHPLEKPAENQTESSVNHSGEKQGNGSLVATAGVLVRDERCESLHDAHVRNSPTPQFEQSLRVEDSSFADVFTGDFASLFSIEPQLTTKFPVGLFVRACQPKFAWSPAGEIIQKNPKEDAVPMWLITVYNANRAFFHGQSATILGNIIRGTQDKGIWYLERVIVLSPGVQNNEKPKYEDDVTMIRDWDSVLIHAFPSQNMEIIGEEIMSRLVNCAIESILPLLSFLSDSQLESFVLPHRQGE